MQSSVVWSNTAGGSWAIGTNWNGGSPASGIDINRPDFHGYEDDLRVYNTALSAAKSASCITGPARSPPMASLSPRR